MDSASALDRVDKQLREILDAYRLEESKVKGEKVEQEVDVEEY